MSEKVSYDSLKKPFIAKMLTTADNPYDPFDQFDEWYTFDTEKNYNTCGLIARYVPIDRDFDVSQSNDEINRIIDRIVQIDPLNQYIIVAKEIVPRFVESE